MNGALKFKHTAVPRQKGEMARAKVISGPDFGAVYVFTGRSVTIGRGEENDIVLSDLKASRRHAEFMATAEGWMVRDVGSANGILVNGKATRGANLQTKDTVSLGETLLEFVSPEAGTLVLVAPARTVDQVHSEQRALAEQKQRIQALGKVGGGRLPGPTGAAAAPGQAAPAANNRKKLIYIGLAALGALALLGGNDNKPDAGAAKKKPGDKKNANIITLDDLSKFLPSNEPGPITRSADSFFRTGFREYKAKNYLRAKNQFETVLQMIPGHPLAMRYLDAVNHEIDDEVNQRLSAGANSLQAGKVREARGHFEAVIRLLFWNPADPKYIQAKENLKRVDEAKAAESGLSGGAN